MTAIAYTAAQISEVFPQNCEVISVKLAEAVTVGLPAYQTTTGTFGIADANASGKQQFRGVFMQAGGAGDVVRLLKRGHVYGFTVASINCDTVVYLADNVGEYADANGTTNVKCGIVTALTDGTRVVYIDSNWSTVWA